MELNNNNKNKNDVGGGEASTVPQNTSRDVEMNSDVSTISNETIHKTEEATKRKHLRLCGAARKRYKWLVEQGYDADEARELAQSPIKTREIKSRAKRDRSEDISPQNAVKKARVTSERIPLPKKNVPQQPPNNANGYIKVGILNCEFPKLLLTSKQMKDIEKAIIHKIAENCEGEIKPKFRGIAYRPGWLAIVCANEITEKWLQNIIPNLEPWNGAKLKVVNEKDMPKTEVLTAYFPRSAEESNDIILRAIQGQNEGLCTKNWRILKRTTLGSAAQITFSVDYGTVSWLREANYMIDFSFTEIRLHSKKLEAKKRSKSDKSVVDGTEQTADSIESTSSKVSIQGKTEGEINEPKEDTSKAHTETTLDTNKNTNKDTELPSDAPVAENLPKSEKSVVGHPEQTGDSIGSISSKVSIGEKTKDEVGKPKKVVSKAHMEKTLDPNKNKSKDTEPPPEAPQERSQGQIAPPDNNSNPL